MTEVKSGSYIAQLEKDLEKLHIRELNLVATIRLAINDIECSALKYGEIDHFNYCKTCRAIKSLKDVLK